MGTHSLPKGKALIDALNRLGKGLGYVVELERAVESDRPNPPVVDVAWFAESGQEYPLMIFEVESRESNSAANNPVKVYGQSSREFEKPLFFFHVFASTGSRSTRVDRLESVFGSYNYRAYRLDRDGLSPLVIDVLSQHRRLRRHLDLNSLLTEFDDDHWKEVPLPEVLQHIESLGFEANYLAEYAQRGQVDQTYRQAFIRLLAKVGFDDAHQVAGYESYIGKAWSTPIHIGVLALEGEGTQDWLDELRQWQEGRYISMIGPPFGRSRDYDQFVLGHSPVLWALTAALMYKVSGVLSYIGSQLRMVLNELENAPPRISFFTAIWTLHIAAADNNTELYEYARLFINGGGGINADILYEPPSLVDISGEDGDWPSILKKDAAEVPSLEAFQHEQASRYEQVSNVDSALYAVSFDSLTCNIATYEWAEIVVRLLYSSACEAKY